MNLPGQNLAAGKAWHCGPMQTPQCTPPLRGACEVAFTPVYPTQEQFTQCSQLRTNPSDGDHNVPGGTSWQLKPQKLVMGQIRS